MLKIQERELKSDHIFSCQCFFPIYFSDRFASILVHQGIELLRASGAGTQKPFPRAHSSLCAVTAPKSRCRMDSSTHPIPSTQQPLCKYCSFPGCTCTVTASRQPWHRRLRTSPGAASAKILPLGLETHRLSQPLSRQCPEPSLTHRGSRPTTQR